MTGPPCSAPVPIFRWSGALWGFVEHERLYDRYGRQAGWIEAVPGRGPDVFDLGGRFLGELFARHYVMRHALREEPVHRTPRVGALHPLRPVRCPPALPAPRSTTGPIPCPGHCHRRTRRRADGDSCATPTEEPRWPEPTEHGRMTPCPSADATC